MDLDRFLNEQNIARYRKLFDASTDKDERAVILELLAEEVAKLKTAPQPKPVSSLGEPPPKRLPADLAVQL